jgi:hypothetical protein
MQEVLPCLECPYIQDKNNGINYENVVHATISEIDEEDFQYEFLLDSCCSQHFCNDIKLFHNYKKQKNIFAMQGNKFCTTEGVGNIILRCHSLISGTSYNLTLYNVVHDPNGKNLISVGKLNNSDFHYCTFPSVNFNNVTYKWYIKHSSKDDVIFEAEQSSRAHECVKLQCTPIHPGQRQSGKSLVVSATITDSEDYKLCPNRFKILDDRHGPFDQELYSDKDNQQKSGNMIHFTKENPAENNCWKNKINYGNCPYTDHAITKMLEKAMNDFMTSVESPGENNHTKYLFILPAWKSTQWYREYSSYFHILETIPKGTRDIFTVPCAESEELPHDKGRKYTGPLRWDVEVWYKDMYTASTITDVKLMHLRLGHMNVKALRQAQKRYKFVKYSRTAGKAPHIMCRQISSTEKVFCSACHVAKFGNFNLSTSNRKAKRKLSSEQGGVTIPENAEFNKKGRAKKFGDLFYVDTLYVILETFLKERFALVFLDYATRQVFVYPVMGRGEEEVIASFQKFIKDAISTVPDCKIQKVQVDKGTEYQSEAWNRTCTQNGIEKLNAPTEGHNSQSPVEVVIRTLKIKMRAMMYTAQCDNQMWSHALLHAAYLYNRTPHSALKDYICPLEAATGKTPEYGRLRVFGCAAYQTIPEQEWLKLRDKDGNPSTSKALANRMKPTMYVGNDSDGNYITYSSKIANEKPESADKGKIKLLFDENVTRYGYSIDKIINNPEAAHVNKYVPIPAKDIAYIKNVAIKSIEDVSISKSEGGNMTHAVVRCETKDEKSVWLRVYNLYSNIHPNQLREEFSKQVTQAHKNLNQNLVKNMQELQKFLMETEKPLQDKHEWLLVPKLRVHQHDNKEVKTPCIVATIDTKGTTQYVIVNLERSHINNDKPVNLKQQSQLRKMPKNVNIMAEYVGCCVYKDLVFGESAQECHENTLTQSEEGHRLTVNSAHNITGDVPLNGHSDSANVHEINKEFLMYQEPLTYKQAMEDKYRSEWQSATDSEIQQFDDKEAMVPISFDEMKGTKPIKSKVVYKLKLFANGDIEKFKARIVAKGYTQIFGINFDETFSPTPAIGGVRFVICFILQYKLKRKSGDVTGAFLESKLKEIVFLEMPEGLTFKGSRYVRLIKSLYGLKQAGRDWNDLQNKIILSFDPKLKQSKQDPCIYFKVEEGCTFIISVHVDDYVIGYDNDEYCDRFIEHYRSHVKFKVEEELQFILQMEIEWTGNQVSMNQNRQIETLVRKHNLLDNKKVYSTPMEHKLKLVQGDKYSLPDVPYRELVASLLFISRYTRPDIAYAVNVLCRAATWYTDDHWKAAIRVLKYLQHTKQHKLTYTRDRNENVLSIYLDSDYGGDTVDRKSTQGGVVLYHGNPIHWYCQKAKDIDQSSTEAEFKNFTTGFRETMYFYNLIEVEMDIKVAPILTWADNISSIFMTRQKVSNGKTKHIEIPYFYAREMVIEKERFNPQHVRTEENTADILTKALMKGPFQKHRASLIVSQSENYTD